MAAATFQAAPAYASLGGQYASIEADQAHMAAQSRKVTTATHSIHTLTIANGAQTREFARSDGRVFAVAWRGRSRPDLKQLLGEYFDTVQSDNALGAGGRRSRRPMRVSRSDLVLQSGGHSGAFWGVAYLPAELPSDFSVSEFQ